MNKQRVLDLINEYLADKEYINKEWVDVMLILKSAFEEKMEKERLVFVKHKHGGNFLFKTECDLQKGDEVRCDTRYGEADGVCVTDSFEVSEDALLNIVQGVGAYLPLRSVLGKYEVEVVEIKELKKFGCLPF